MKKFFLLALFLLAILLFLRNHSINSVDIIIIAGVVLILFLLRFLFTSKGRANGQSSDIPTYSNWDRVYDSLSNSSQANGLASTKEQAIQYHFKADYSKTKRSFEEDDKLRGICDYEKTPLFGFFEKFEKIIEYSEFVKGGTEGEFYLRYRHPNGEEWFYHHWPIRENTEWDIQMRKGEIRIGNTYLRYGLSGRPKFQYWKTCMDGELVGFDPERGEV